MTARAVILPAGLPSRLTEVIRKCGDQWADAVERTGADEVAIVLDDGHAHVGPLEVGEAMVVEGIRRGLLKPDVLDAIRRRPKAGHVRALVADDRYFAVFNTRLASADEAAAYAEREYRLTARQALIILYRTEVRDLKPEARPRHRRWKAHVDRLLAAEAARPNPRDLGTLLADLYEEAAEATMRRTGDASFVDDILGEFEVDDDTAAKVGAALLRVPPSRKRNRPARKRGGR